MEFLAYLRVREDQGVRRVWRTVRDGPQSEKRPRPEARSIKKHQRGIERREALNHTNEALLKHRPDRQNKRPLPPPRQQSFIIIPTMATITDFTYITPSISFHKAPDSPSSQSNPSLIIFCTWMGALPKHIQKYTSHYLTLFPHSSILLLQCSVPAIFYTSAKQRTLLAPARDIISSFEREGRGQGRGIVLHAMSNGGSTIACHLALQLREDGEEFQGFERVILDCAPSFPTVEGAVDAISFSLPPYRVLRWLLHAAIFLYLLFVVRLAGREDGVRWIRRVLNDGELFKRRMYVYSKEDALVQNWAVEVHAEDAGKKGLEVMRERFEQGRHCALGIGEGGERYWGAVEKFFKGQ